MAVTNDPSIRVVVASFLAWIVPGLGHVFLGERVRGIIFMVAIGLTFWTGVAVGGVRSTVDPNERQLWFLAQLCTGGHALTAYGLTQIGGAEVSAAAGSGGAGTSALLAHWVSVDVAIHYTGVAGLLNLLVIFDAILRADPNIRVIREDGESPARKGVT